MKYHFVYKTTNKVNNNFYYGVHNTDNLDDGYIGSGYALKKAVKKYGVENFEREILKFFETMEEAFEYEKELVNEDVIRNKMCYNMQIGGRYFNTNGKVVVKDCNGKCFWVFKDDKLFTNGILKPNWTGEHHKLSSREKTRKKMTPEDSKNNRIWVCKNGIAKYIRKELLDDYLSNGWEKGRVGYKPRKNCQGKTIKETECANDGELGRTVIIE